MLNHSYRLFSPKQIRIDIVEEHLKDNDICEILDFEGSVFQEIENFNLSFGAKQEIYFNYYYEKDKNKLYSELYDYGEKNG